MDPHAGESATKQFNTTPCFVFMLVVIFLPGAFGLHFHANRI